MATIAVLAGDGIGPDIMAEGVKVLRATAAAFSLDLEFQDAPVGGAAYDISGTPLPEETLAVCDRSDAIFFGAVGGPRWDALPADKRPETGALLPLRSRYHLFANLRPAVIFEPLAHAAALKNERIGEGFDVLILRELTGGIYFGNHKVRTLELDETDLMGGYDSDIMVYSEGEVERIVRMACETARKRRGKVTSVDKANVLANSKIWRQTAERVAAEYTDIEFEHLYVDNAAMQLGTYPRQFDVIVTGNMFGDILSDLASAITGSIGMLASASIAETGFGLYEPVHGSAPDIAGSGKANPLAQILSGAMLLKHSLGAHNAAAAIESAVDAVLRAGYRTADIATPGDTVISTVDMGDKVTAELTE